MLCAYGAATSNGQGESCLSDVKGKICYNINKIALIIMVQYSNTRASW